MTVALHVTAIEVVDNEDRRLLAKVSAFDGHCAEVRLAEVTHNAESWAELTVGIAEAIGMLKLEAA